MWTAIFQFFVIIALTIFLSLAISIASIVAAYKQLEYTKVQHIEDGKTDVLITLKLGPFSYTINVPERKEGEI